MKHLKLQNKQQGFVGALISVAGGLLANKLSRDEAQRAEGVSAASTAKQMAFQERMSNTAHQREIIDLRMAGLNPILSSKYGGASTPSGSSFSGIAAKQSDPLTPAVQAYWQGRQVQSTVGLQDAQSIQSGTQSDKNTADAQLANAKRLELEGTTPRVAQEIKNMMEVNRNLQEQRKAISKDIIVKTTQAALNRVKTEITRAQLNNVKTLITQMKADQQFYKVAGEGAKWFDRIIRALGAAR